MSALCGHAPCQSISLSHVGPVHHVLVQMIDLQKRGELISMVDGLEMDSVYIFPSQFIYFYLTRQHAPNLNCPQVPKCQFNFTINSLAIFQHIFIWLLSQTSMHPYVIEYDQHAIYYSIGDQNWGQELASVEIETHIKNASHRHQKNKLYTV